MNSVHVSLEEETYSPKNDVCVVMLVLLVLLTEVVVVGEVFVVGIANVVVGYGVVCIPSFCATPSVIVSLYSRINSSICGLMVYISDSFLNFVFTLADVVVVVVVGLALVCEKMDGV